MEQTTEMKKEEAKAQVGRKPRMRRAKIKLPPKMPIPVRALWEVATQEEREKAHQSGVILLQVWLGQMSKEEASKQLGIPPLRIWQLSRQAISGMVAGLLKQPKMRKGKAALESLKQEEGVNTKALEKRVKELERENTLQKELIELLRAMPARKGEAEEVKKKSLSAKPGQQAKGG